MAAISRFSAALFALALAGLIPARAETACLTFEEAIRIGMSNDPDIAEADALVAAAQARLRQTEASQYIQVSSYARSASGDSGLTDTRTDNQVGLVASVRLFDFGKARLAGAASGARVEVAEAERAARQIRSAATAAQAFVTVLEATQMLRAAQAREASLDAESERLERQLEAGLITIGTASRVRADVAVSRASALQAGLNLSQAQLALDAVVSQSASVCEALEPVDLYLRSRFPDDPDMLVVMAADRDPNLDQLAASLRAADADVERARRERLPTIEAQAIAAQARNDQLGSWVENSQVQVELTAPLLSGGRLSAAGEETRAGRQALRMQQVRAERDLRERVLLIWTTASRLVALAEARTEVVDSLQAKLEATRRAFDMGQATFKDVSDDEAAYQLSLLDAIAARHDVQRARIDLLAAIYNLSDEAAR